MRQKYFGKGLLGSIPSEGTHCWIMAVKGDEESGPAWKLKAALPFGMPGVSKGLIAGDIVEVVIARIGENHYFRRLHLIQRGPWGEDLDVNGAPKDYHISYERYMLHCGVDAQVKQGFYFSISKSTDVFEQLFMKRTICWRGVVQRRHTFLRGKLSPLELVVMPETPTEYNEPVLIEFSSDCADCVSKCADGDLIVFEGALKSQGGPFIHWHSIAATRIAIILGDRLLVEESFVPSLKLERNVGSQLTGTVGDGSSSMRQWLEQIRISHVDSVAMVFANHELKTTEDLVYLDHALKIELDEALKAHGVAIGDRAKLEHHLGAQQHLL